MHIEVTENEKKLIDIVRRLQPFDKLEIAMNQDGSQLSTNLHISKREVFSLRTKVKVSTFEYKDRSYREESLIDP